MTLVKAVITSQVTYYLTPLIVPPKTIKFINKIERAFLWSAKETTTGVKCMVNWETVCRPTNLGRLEVKNLDKLAMALCLRWPWLEWTNSKFFFWVGHGNPCSAKDTEIFYATTTISVGNRRKTPFWDAPWLQGRKPKEITPLIYASSESKT
jgi:hypothetical protein